MILKRSDKSYSGAGWRWLLGGKTLCDDNDQPLTGLELPQCQFFVRGDALVFVKLRLLDSTQTSPILIGVGKGSATV